MRNVVGVWILVLGTMVTLIASGCSVGMALSGKREPNLGAFRIGSTRGEVELQLGSPVDTVTRPDGGRTDIYEYELHNEPIRCENTAKRGPSIPSPKFQRYDEAVRILAVRLNTSFAPRIDHSVVGPSSSVDSRFGAGWTGA